MISVPRADIDRLLERHGIASTEIGGTASAAAATGGRVATIAVSREGAHAIVAIVMGDARIEGTLPLDEAQAVSMVEGLKTLAKIPANHHSFERMVVDLLIKTSALYLDSGADSLTFASVHLHPGSYHIGHVEMQSETPLHVKPRRESEGADRRATLNQRHRTDQRFRR